MVAQILDGAKLAKQIQHEIKDKIIERSDQGFHPPGIAVILLGDNPASHLYVTKKIKTCQAVGMHSFPYFLPSTTTQDELLALIDKLNQDPTVHGILVQLPLPLHICTAAITEHIKPEKDVDGFHPYNIGRLALRQPGLRPCTPAGIMRLLDETEVELIGKHAVIVGASNIVGRPMALELLFVGATVTVTHRFTVDLPAHIQRADILISAVGKPNLIAGEWVKEGAIVIDVGINRLDNGELVGDIEFEVAKERASWITPVPGGVGPMTVATLLHNTLLAAENNP
ncbi:MAG: bifunctional methylenetetrahydrofolate dehydrogenase/methenyltetrahydrofolate cyclohydrolase FolD [Gammaproteobacteria bacterium]